MIVTPYGHLDQASKFADLTLAATGSPSGHDSSRVPFPPARREEAESGDWSDPGIRADAPPRERDRARSSENESRPREGHPRSDRAEGEGERARPADRGEEGRRSPGADGGEEIARAEASRPAAGEARPGGNGQPAADPVSPFPPNPAAGPGRTGSRPTPSATPARTAGPGRARPASLQSGQPTAPVRSAPGQAADAARKGKAFPAGYRPPLRPTPEIPRALGETIIKRITLFTDRTGGEAVLDLDPPELGRLGVRLAFEEDRVSLHLHAANETVAAFLEKNMEALRHAFDELGLNVTRATITDAATGESHARFTRNAQSGPTRARRIRAATDPSGANGAENQNSAIHHLDEESLVNIVI